MSFQERTSQLSDQQRLGIFVWTLYEDLDTVVEIRRELFDGGGYLDFIDILPDAWREIIPDRERVFNEVVHADLARLRRAGVAGWSLTAKLEAWNSARERMLDEFDIGGPEITTSPAIPRHPHHLRHRLQASQIGSSDG